MAKEITDEQVALLAESARHAASTVCTVPIEQLKAQAEAGRLLVRVGCPFCGDTRPALLEWDHDPFEPDNPLWHAECQCCGAHGPVASSAEDAAVRWNNRAPR